MTPYPVEIAWLDCCGDYRTWIHADEFDYNQQDRSMLMLATGYFLKKTKLATYITMQVRQDPSCGGMIFSGPTSIPNKCIVKIRRLK